LPLLQALPVIPIFYHIPFSAGVTKTVDTNFSTDDKGSIFLLERLGILKSQEARFKLTEDPEIAEMVISYASLTAFGVEVYHECVGFSGGKKRRKAPRKSSPRPDQAVRRIGLE
jgi:hypothetical protein